MDSEKLAGVLSGVPGTQVSVESGVVVVTVPAIGDAARLAPGDVLGFEVIVAPTGLPAVQVGVRRGHEELPLIVTVDEPANDQHEVCDTERRRSLTPAFRGCLRCLCCGLPSRPW